MIAEATVLAQPHRRGNTDQRCATVFGQFCIRAKLRSELYDAGEEYAAIVRRWRAAKGIPSPYANATSKGSREPTAEMVNNLKSRMIQMDKAMMAISFKDYLAVRQLVLDGFELGMDQYSYAVSGLISLAVHLEYIRPTDVIYSEAA